MKNYGLLVSSGYLIREMALRPNSVFEKIKRGGFLKETVIVFVIGALIPLVKSFFIRKQSITFFADEWINQLLSTLNIPQLSWAISYIGYFGFLFCVYGICRLFNKKSNLRAFTLAFMGISAIGIVGQVFFYVLQFILSKSLLLFGGYVLYLWVVWLSLQAIRVTQGFSFLKTLVAFFSPFIVIVAIMGLTAICPYLVWLTS